MNSQNSKIDILIVGAFGTLGSRATKHCLTEPNLVVNILVRDPTKNKELADEVKQAGGKVFQGDITKPETFRGVSQGMHTVIFTLPSTLGSDPTEGQIAMIDDCVANGVKRIVPSMYIWNVSKFSPEEIAGFDVVNNKFKVIDHLKNLPVKTLVINTGLFLDSLFKMTLKKDFTYWGSGDQRYQMTPYDDVAQFIACAVSRENLDGHLVVASHDLSINELTDIYNKVRGSNITPKSLGSFEDLKAKSKELEPNGGFEAILMKLWTILFTEKSRYDQVNTNDFPEFKVTSVEDFLKQKPDL